MHAPDHEPKTEGSTGTDPASQADSIRTFLSKITDDALWRAGMQFVCVLAVFLVASPIWALVCLVAMGAREAHVQWRYRRLKTRDLSDRSTQKSIERAGLPLNFAYALPLIPLWLSDTEGGKFFALAWFFSIMMSIATHDSVVKAKAPIGAAPQLLTLGGLLIHDALTVPAGEWHDLALVSLAFISFTAFFFKTSLGTTNSSLNALTSEKESARNRLAAERADQRLALALRQTRIGLFDFDMILGTVYASDFIRDLTGITDYEVRAAFDDPVSHIHPEDRERVRSAILKVLRGDAARYDAVYRFLKPGQAPDAEDIIWVRAAGTAEHDETGRATRFIGSLMDVTEERHAQDRLEDARRLAEGASAAKSTFLASVSHEIRTPMNGVLGMAQALSGSALNPTQKLHVDTIIDCGQTLLALLNDVLDLSKIEAGRLDITPRDLDLAEIVTQLDKLWRPPAEEKDLTFVVTLDPAAPTLLSVDAIRVRQCISNLLSNAIKFTEHGRIDMDVTVGALSSGTHEVCVTVQDTGIGIEPEMLDDIFMPFAQADTSTSRRFGGTGLGLSISRNLARLMGGDISAQSNAGSGSTFTFTFRAASGQQAAMDPAEAEPSADDKSATGTEDQKTGLRVLLVDDNLVNRQVVRLLLKDVTQRVVEAENGVEALRALEREAADVVLLDMHMPIMGGAEAIGCIRESTMAWASVPVIALTADAMQGDREKCLAMGFDGYVSKPVDMNELIGEIEQVTGGAGRAAWDLDDDASAISSVQNSLKAGAL